MTGFIYFIAAEPLEAVKIGFSRYHPASRMSQLQIGSAAPLKLLAFVEGSLKEEAALHQLFASLHIHGEWFRIEGKLQYLLSQISSRSLDDPVQPIFDTFVLQQIAAPNRDAVYKLEWSGHPLGGTE